jgi:glycosyltransferase involved in cell wall biosynthesis
MASGYGIEEKKNPKKVEHFGITTVEAMAAGAVPIIFAAGGHKEIIADGENGFLWKDTSSLLKSTKRIIEEKGLMKKLSTKAKMDSGVYEYERFEEEIIEFI